MTAKSPLQYLCERWMVGVDPAVPDSEATMLKPGESMIYNDGASALLHADGTMTVCMNGGVEFAISRDGFLWSTSGTTYVETLARALFDWEHSDEAAEKGEAFAGPQQPNGVRMCRDDFDARMMKALDVMWRLREVEANAARAKAHGILRMMKLRGGL